MRAGEWREVKRADGMEWIFTAFHRIYFSFIPTELDSSTSETVCAHLPSSVVCTHTILCDRWLNSAGEETSVIH